VGQLLDGSGSSIRELLETTFPVSTVITNYNRILTVNTVFEIDPSATRFDKAFHFIQAGNFTRLETLGIVQHKTRILLRNNWFIDIAYPVLFM
jgi:hypothetical protein